MPKVRVHGFSISLDGYGTGPQQDQENALGRDGLSVHDWIRRTRVFKEMIGEDPSTGETGVDDEFLARGFENIGAWILGRNMFARAGMCSTATCARSATS